MKKSLIALAFGTLGLGIAEFVMMGILPDVVKDLGISIPTAGHFNYWVLLAARFISGLPHGAYFGVGSIVAEKLADKGKGSEAVSIMIAGMTIANLFGVPLGTSLSTMLS